MNFKVIRIITAIMVVWANIGCQSEEFRISEDGYQYKYVKKGSGETPKQGEVVVYNMMYKNEKDSVLFESTDVQPVMFPCDTNQWNQMGILYKAFSMLKEGDSVLLKFPTKQLFAESFKAPVPPYLNTEGEITFCVGASKYMSREEADEMMRAMQKEQMKGALEERKKYMDEFITENQEKINSDLEIIDKHLKENQIIAQSTASGLRYTIDNEGTGDHPEPGNFVKVHYTGTLLDGTKFDSSLDRNAPIDFQLGLGNVIIGWDLGIMLLKKGGKGTLYIPSSLAYGPQARSEIIKANSILKFEIELVDIN
ncbi:MAG: FKBP-type peptidyl-prolyl cis-trans isomerase [Cytophagales bacterium]|nr:FKBP-type peptidyl-prolyl cis-trans isomerase [Cytophagales bacterium]